MNSPLIKVFLGALFISFAPVFVKLVNLPPTTIGFYRVFLGFLVLFMADKRVRSVSGKSPGFWLLIMIAAFLFAADLYVWHRSVVIVGAGMGTILGNTQVFYVILFSALLWGERVTPIFLISVIIAFIGVYLLVSVSDSRQGTNYWFGITYGLLTGLFYSGYLLSLRLCEKRFPQVLTQAKMAWVCAVCALFMLGLSAAEGTLVLPNAQDAVWLFLLALLPQVCGWVLITHNLPKVPAGRASLVLLTQPVLATLWGVLFFKEKLDTWQLLGAALTLAAIYVGTQSKMPQPTSAIVSDT